MSNIQKIKTMEINKSDKEEELGALSKEVRDYDSNGTNPLLNKEYSNSFKPIQFPGFELTNSTNINLDEEGEAIITFDNGNVYEGAFKQHMFNGSGKMTYANGDVYNGDWKDDQFHGHGVYTYKNHDFYNGQWCNGNMCGIGEFCWHNFAHHKGEYKNSKRNGYGVFHDVKGLCYEGNWVDDMKSGIGKETYMDGSYYEGEWLHGSYNGYGELHGSNGKVQKGQWCNGVLVKSTSTFCENCCTIFWSARAWLSTAYCIEANIFGKEKFASIALNVSSSFLLVFVVSKFYSCCYRWIVYKLLVFCFINFFIFQTTWIEIKDCI